MSCFEFTFLPDPEHPEVADLFVNAGKSGTPVRIGQIDQIQGSKYRTNLFLPNMTSTLHPTCEDARTSMTTEVRNWFDRMGLSAGDADAHDDLADSDTRPFRLDEATRADIQAAVRDACSLPEDQVTKAVALGIAIALQRGVFMEA